MQSTGEMTDYLYRKEGVLGVEGLGSSKATLACQPALLCAALALG